MASRSTGSTRGSNKKRIAAPVDFGWRGLYALDMTNTQKFKSGEHIEILTGIRKGLVGTIVDIENDGPHQLLHIEEDGTLGRFTVYGARCGLAPVVEEPEDKDVEPPYVHSEVSDPVRRGPFLLIPVVLREGDLTEPAYTMHLTPEDAMTLARSLTDAAIEGFKDYGHAWG